MATIAAVDQPVRLEAELDEPLSRWLWLVKWLLLFPHHVALLCLWAAFLVVSVIAFFVTLFTGRYPRALFNFTTGVARWTWRVAYYSYAALATDRYPPFSLGVAPGYPTRVDIAYPRLLPRGLRLVIWWLRATPQYALVALCLLSFRICWWIGGLTALLAEVALVVLVFTGPGGILLFTGRYPQRQFAWIIAFDRWMLTVFAYAFLMTTAYPPFRMDKGGIETGASGKPAARRRFAVRRPRRGGIAPLRGAR
ncbi:DUF4389 domain-containing protein [Streptantibioticus ferralitis]|uniref:DUF4389 domain-containing protein n=1 Tax=Streptantibioticus ferralitis TaxID=236510 RepID=A0ABT5Z853_9ACTN|nr:DUF4389 domain-containing protein [Streptantibioticus ferralitis]MDF2259944.1 DUF4389 domain-containing protein [Streptantibioticus ferralitis]